VQVRRRTLVKTKLFVGTAGWTVPKQHLALFSAWGREGAKRSHLERYASRLCCTEINSSFHRPHRRTTWERWAATTPDDFRFAVKAPKAVTHTAKLVNTGRALLEFFDAVHGLGNKARARARSTSTETVLRRRHCSRILHHLTGVTSGRGRFGTPSSQLVYCLSRSSIAKQLQGLENASEIWVIFDNTALGHATANAVWMDDAFR
jgi:uncharacterized protein YecE (DUF72 family)